MSNVVPLNNYPSRCNDCLYTSDCPLITENGGVSNVANKTRVRVLHAADHLYRAVVVARQLADRATDWNLMEVEIDGQMVPTYEVKQWFDAAIALADGEVQIPK